MLVLGIETTCDETACAIVKDGKQILANVVFSQIKFHEKFGGVVPELACRKHVDILIPVIDEAIKQANVSLKAIDLIAVAHGPGLIGALLIGLNAAKTLSIALQKPFIGVNHVEAHLYASLMNDKEVQFPAMGVILSGGHTSLVLMNNIGDYQLIGQTVDDAIGEAFDKAAKMMGLPYPGGPEIEKLAKDGDPKSYNLRAGVVKSNPYDFSFSGLKTAVLYTLQKSSDLKNIAASFQEAAFKDVLKKTVTAANAYNCKTLVFGGGVTNNQYLRNYFKKEAKEFNQLWPEGILSLDNAAMIAGLGYHQFLKKGADSLELEAMTSISF